MTCDARYLNAKWADSSATGEAEQFDKASRD